MPRSLNSTGAPKRLLSTRQHAETPSGGHGRNTVLHKDEKTLLHQQSRVQHYQPKANRQNIVACTDLEEFSDGILSRRQMRPLNIHG